MGKFLSVVVLSFLLLIGACGQRESAPKKDLSLDACHGALLYMGISHLNDEETNPPGPNHSLEKDEEASQLLRSRCATSGDRFALVKSYLTDDRLMEMLEEMASAHNQMHEVGGYWLKCQDELKTVKGTH